MSRGQARELALVTRITDGYLIQTRTTVRFAASIDAMLAIVREVAEEFNESKPDPEMLAQQEELMKTIRANIALEEKDDAEREGGHRP